MRHPSKGFVGGVFTGYILTNLTLMLADGAFKRMKEILDYHKEHPGEAADAKTMFNYILDGGTVYKPSQDVDPQNVSDIRQKLAETATQAQFQQIKRVQAMSEEGYSNVEIADAMGLPENRVREWLKSTEETK